MRETQSLLLRARKLQFLYPLTPAVRRQTEVENKYLTRSRQQIELCLTQPSHLIYNIAEYTTSCNVSCWKCNVKINADTERFFCSSCKLIQPPHPCLTYFEVMGIPEMFELDTSSLTKIYRDLQRQLHPDKFTQKTQEEREHSAVQSSRVNIAYNTLLKPLSRGLYMLKLHGLSLEEGEIQMESEFLMHIMEINEAVAEAEDTNEIRHIENDNSEILGNLIQEVSLAFERNDIPKAKENLAKIKYYANIDEKIKEFYHERAGSVIS